MSSRAGRLDGEEDPPRHRPQNRDSSESKLRRGGKHCPLCLAPIRKNAARTRLIRSCTACRAHVSAGKQCQRCGHRAIWENKSGAACRSCGLHGAKAAVIAGDTAS